MEPKEILKKKYQQSCWWCGSRELTGEHKFKKKDLERLYGKGTEFDKIGVSIIDYRSNKLAKKLQSSKSIFAQFEKSLCPQCNNSKSQPFDLAYDRLIEYYLKNEEEIKSEKYVDFFNIYGENWEEGKRNFSKYIMKHVGCRLSEAGLTPFESTIEYLDGFNQHNHLKIILQIKPFDILNISTLYKGPLIQISHEITKRSITSVCGWFTVKNITFNYIYEWDILGHYLNNSSKMPIEIVDYSTFLNRTFNLNIKNISTDFSKIIEALEFFPFIANRDEIKIYEYFRNKKNILTKYFQQAQLKQYY